MYKSTRYVNGVDTMTVNQVIPKFSIQEEKTKMEGIELVRRDIKQLNALRKDVDKTRDFVAKFANNVTASIHTLERTVDAREAVRNIDFARELLSLSASYLEKILVGYEHEIPLIKTERN
jgi:Asp-tRNA(Asn)/Glu-tRNA(Gln) amidotransferase C subunit